MINYIKKKFDNYMYPIIAIYVIGFILLIGRTLIDSIVNLDLNSLLIAIAAIAVVIPVFWVFLVLFQGIARLMGFDRLIANRFNDSKYLRKDKRDTTE